MSFSFTCKNCKKFVEYHSFEELKRCREILKSKSGNLDKWT